VGTAAPTGRHLGSAPALLSIYAGAACQHSPLSRTVVYCLPMYPSLGSGAGDPEQALSSSCKSTFLLRLWVPMPSSTVTRAASQNGPGSA
jgi:hypothetical protein